MKWKLDVTRRFGYELVIHIVGQFDRPGVGTEF
jgi:hypothetical protein